MEFGNARFVYNRCLDLRSKAYEADKTRHNYVSLNRLVTEWKRGEFWLADSAACCLTRADRSGQGVQRAFLRSAGGIPVQIPIRPTSGSVSVGSAANRAHPQKPVNFKLPAGRAQGALVASTDRNPENGDGQQNAGRALLRGVFVRGRDSIPASHRQCGWFGPGHQGCGRR